MLLRQDQHFIILESFVTADDYLFVGFQSFGHFIILRVLPSDTNGSAISLVSVFIQYENPFASRSLEKGSFGNQQSLFG